MIHRPCGRKYDEKSPCLNEKLECTKKFPKPFSESTVIGEDGFPKYRRRDDKREAYVRGSRGNSANVNNQWVVPYNAMLLLKYDCHINVELSTNIKGVKYLFKYVYKGFDCAEVCLDTDEENTTTWDETKTFVNSRYVSPPEACWKIFENRMHGRSHGVIRLQVHLPKENIIIFNEGNEHEAALRAVDAKTTLLAWFDLNATDENAKKFTYVQIPYNYTYAKGEWKKRQKNCKIVSRMYNVSPKDIERYALRVLLLHVKGATSFESIRTLDNRVYSSFHEAAVARGLFENDDEWRSCMTEASTLKMPKQLRNLFATICVFTNISDPKSLFNQFIDYLCEDFLQLQYETNESIAYAMDEINFFLRIHGRTWTDFNLSAPLRAPVVSLPVEVSNVMENFNFNEDQRAAYSKIIEAIETQSQFSKCFYIDGPGGTGKTFLYNALINYVETRGYEFVAVASTGIAATLLKGGRTAHSAYKIPVPTFEDSVSHLKPNDIAAAKLRRSKLFVWDECTMANKHMLRVVDLLLKEIMNNTLPFGGKVFVLGGDFRQILPVVKHGNKNQIIASLIKSSFLWSHFKICQLKQNMRTSDNEREFADWLLEIGNGKNTTIEFPDECLTTDIISAVYGEGPIVSDGNLNFANSAILCPKNSQTFALNETIIDKFTGEPRTYYSADSICIDDTNCDASMYTVEFLNSLTPSGMPTHKLTLKPGVIIMLLRNINTSKGLCNGTRLTVINLFQHFIHAKIVAGSFANTETFIPRVSLSPSDADIPFRMTRLQFPVRVSFAMTINKSQGQTFDKAGVFLQEPVFTHGQLYVSLSRVRTKEGLKVFCKDKSTANVVYTEVLNQLV